MRAGLAVYADAHLNLFFLQIEGRLSGSRDGAGGQGHSHRAAILIDFAAQGCATVEVISSDGGRTQDFFRQHRGADTSPACGIKAFFHRDVVVDQDALDRYPFGMDELCCCFEVHHVTGVVFHDEKHTGTTVYGQSARVHLVRCG